MAVTVNGVTAKERWAGFRKGRGQDGPWVTMEYLVPFAYADDFADGVMGGISVTGTPPTQTIRNNPRQRCPTNPALYALAVDEIEYVGERGVGVGSRPTFDLAIVRVHYGILTWPQAFTDDPGAQQSFPVESQPGLPLINAECEIDYGEETLSIPGGKMKYVSDDKLVEQPQTIRVAITTYRITRYNYPDLPSSKVSSLVGTINAGLSHGAPYDTFLGQAEGHVRFAGARTRLQMTANGTKCQLFEATYQVRQQGWNYVPRPDSSLIWDRLYCVGDPTKGLYDYANLFPLLS